MCGRYAASADPETLVEEYRIDEVSEDGREACAPRYNIAPTQQVAAITQQNGERVLGSFRWGLEKCVVRSA